ncbi:hypothetical protein GCM10010329_19840 [Streptomyces spiroverticillatus]|uniref:YtxH domain-containing protein n=1 Tax=Streptomyces finlayi TaxID=67296 RepID=A0A918WTZ4_9ACTN|nr:hypothetical protein [Streptomyces finlayi]GGZ98398.1 hypothetical protein GCM10010329_19840 [Streptomyces spiroverticillatus]GHC83301.1 hypothetical protein GCM10010334_12280 [Streptomyces finlayi]
MKITRAAGAAVLASVLAFGVSACGDDTKSAGDAVSDATKKAGDVAASATAKAGDVAASATAKAGEAADKAKEAYASASASAEEKFKEVKDGADAKDEVKVGAVKEDGDRSTAEVTATNKETKAQTYLVQVNFRDSGGNLLDAVVVNVKDVAAGKDGTAVAKSNRALGGEVKADIGKAVRHG